MHRDVCTAWTFCSNELAITQKAPLWRRHFETFVARDSVFTPPGSRNVSIHQDRRFLKRLRGLCLCLSPKGNIRVIAICKIVDSFSRKHYHKIFAGKKVAFSLMLWK